MHGYKEADLESLDELTASKGIAIAYASVYGEHHHIEAVSNLADVLQLAQILLLMSYRVNVFVKLLTIDSLTWLGIGEKSCIPVFKSPAWKIRFPSVSIIQDTPLSVLPNAQTEIVPSDHVPPLASHTSASSLLALRCL